MLRPKDFLSYTAGHSPSKSSSASTRMFRVSDTRMLPKFGSEIPISSTWQNSKLVTLHGAFGNAQLNTYNRSEQSLEYGSDFERTESYQSMAAIMSNIMDHKTESGAIPESFISGAIIQQTDFASGFASMLENYCRLRTADSNNIAENSLVISESMRKAKIFVYPFAKIVLSPACQLAAICFSLFVVFSSASTLMFFVNDYGVVNASMFRISPHFHVNVSHQTCSRILQEKVQIQFFLGNCPIESQRSLSEIDSSSVVRFESEIRVNNFRIIGLSTPVHIQGSSDGVRWKSVGSSNYRATAHGIRLLDLNQALPQSVIDHRPPWPLALEVLSHILAAVGILCIVCCGISERVGLAQQLTIVLCCLKMCAEAVCAGGYVLVGLPREALHTACQAASWVVWTALLQSTYLGTFLVLIIFGAARIICRVSSDCLLFSDCEYLAYDPPLLGSACILMGSALVCLRSQSIRKALAEIEPSAIAFDREWDRLSHSPEHLDSLAKLERSEAMIRTRMGKMDDVRQSLHPAQRGCSRQTAVADLNQLYAQAIGMTPILCSACACWAAESGGELDYSCDEQATENKGPEKKDCLGSRLEEACTRAEEDIMNNATRLQDSITEIIACWTKRGTLKDVRRAADKAVACYGGDVSRILDICRQRIVFTSVSGIADCLGRIAAAWPTVRVLLIKNSLRPDHDPRMTAGFRGVVLRLCISSSETRALGVERHVCEVILTATAWALKDRDSSVIRAQHRAYVAFRASRLMMGDDYSCWYHGAERSVAAPVSRAHMYADALAMPLDISEDQTAHEKSDSEGSARVKTMTAEFFEYKGDCLSAQNLQIALQRAVFATYRQLTQLPAGILDQALTCGTLEAVRGCQGSSACFSSQPLATATCRRRFQIPLFLTALLLFYLVALHARRAALLSTWDLTGRRVRFTVLGFRGGKPPPPGVASFRAFGLHLDGCPISSVSQDNWTEQHSVQVRLAGASRANGYFFETGAGPPEYDPVRWVVEAGVGDDGPTSWETIGASFMFWNQTAIQVSGTIEGELRPCIQVCNFQRWCQCFKSLVVQHSRHHSIFHFERQGAVYAGINRHMHVQERTHARTHGGTDGAPQPTLFRQIR